MSITQPTWYLQAYTHPLIPHLGSLNSNQAHLSVRISPKYYLNVHVWTSADEIALVGTCFPLTHTSAFGASLRLDP